MKNRRPFSVTLLVIGVLSLTSLQLARFILALRQWSFIVAGPANISPLYLIVTGLVWGLAGLPLAWGLWRGREWAPKTLIGFGSIYTFYYWIERILLVREPAAYSNRFFMLGLTIFLSVFIVWTLTRPRARAFFGEMHAQSPED
jgi:hypothetical protein